MSEHTKNESSHSQWDGVVQGADSPRQVAGCNFVRILPVRYALSSEENPPVQEESLPAYMKSVEQKPNLKYTLRLLRNGFVHVYDEQEKRAYSWEVEDGKVLQTEACPLSARENEGFYIRLPEDWGQARIAFSDASGEDFWTVYGQDGAARQARMHLVTWEKGTKGIAAQDTLCGPPEKIDTWVEEFRKEPGFVRALFEYEDASIQEYYDADLGHFKPTTFPPALVRRWQRTKSWSVAVKNLPQAFKSLLQAVREGVETEADTILEELKKYDLSGLVVLADPAGICLECAAVHQYSLQAWNDFTTWYAQASTLCQYLKAWDAESGPFSRQAMVFDPEALERFHRAASRALDESAVKRAAVDATFSRKPVVHTLLDHIRKGSTCMDGYLDVLMDFWLEWLNGTERFSFGAAAKDYDTSTQRGSDGWETLFSLCTYEFTTHDRAVQKVRDIMAQASPLGDMLTDRLEHSLWAKKEDNPKDEHFGFAQIILNFTGLLPTRLDLARGDTVLTPSAERLIGALNDILRQKLGRILKDSPDTDDVVLAKFLARVQNAAFLPEAAPISSEMPFGISLRSSVALDKLGQPVTGMEDREHVGLADVLKSGGLTVEVSQKVAKLYPLFKQSVRLIGAFPAFSGGAGGTDASVTAAAAEGKPGKKISIGVSNLLDGVGIFLAFFTFALSVEAQLTDKKRGRLGWAEVAINAFAVIELCTKSKIQVFSRTYDIVAGPLGAILETSPAWVRNTASYIKLPFTPAVAGRIAGWGTAFWCLYLAGQEAMKGEKRVAVGNIILSAGALFLMGGAVLVGVAVSALGLVLVMFGKTSRLQYRIANCYLGEDNKTFPQVLAKHDPNGCMKNSYDDFSRWNIERVDGFDPDTFKAVVPFSYAQGHVQADALDHKEQPDFYTKRCQQLGIDIRSLELIMTSVLLQAYYDRQAKRLYVQIIVPFAALSSCLQVVELNLVEACAQHDAYSYPICAIPHLESIQAECTLKDGSPCWVFDFPAPPESLNALDGYNPQNLYSAESGLSYYTAVSAKINVNFASEEDWQAHGFTRKAIEMLQMEDAAYMRIDDTFRPRKESQYRTLRNYTIRGSVVPIAGMK